MYNSGGTRARSYIYFIGCLEKIEDFNARAPGEKKNREIYGGRVCVKLNFVKIIIIIGRRRRITRTSIETPRLDRHNILLLLLRCI